MAQAIGRSKKTRRTAKARQALDKAAFSGDAVGIPAVPGTRRGLIE